MSGDTVAAIGAEFVGEPVRLDWTSVALQVSGSQDWNRPHHDPDFVRDSGHDEIFFNTGWTAAMLTRVVTDWAGDRGWLSHLDMRLIKMNSPGDTVVVRARITGRRSEQNEGELVDFDVWIDSDRHGVTTTGHATVRLFGA